MTNTINDVQARARLARIAIEAHSPGSSADMSERTQGLMDDLAYLAYTLDLHFIELADDAMTNYQHSLPTVPAPVEVPKSGPMYVTYSLATGVEIRRGYVCAQVTDFTILAAKSGALSDTHRGCCTGGIYFETVLFDTPPPLDTILHRAIMTGTSINLSYVAFPPRT